MHACCEAPVLADLAFVMSELFKVAHNGILPNIKLTQAITHAVTSGVVPQCSLTVYGLAIGSVCVVVIGLSSMEFYVS